VTRITGIDAAIVELPLDRAFWAANRPIRRATEIVVRVRTDRGIEGIGVARGTPLPRIRQLVVDHLAPLLVGQDPHRVEALWSRMFARSRMFAITYERGAALSGNTGASYPKGAGRPQIAAAIAAVDIALWDLAGKLVELPTWQLLGGASHRVRAYATGGYYGDDGATTELGDEYRAYVDHGFQAVKLKIGGLAPAEDLRRVETVRDAIGDDVELMVAASQGWSITDAVAAGRGMDAYGVTWFEEPVHWYDDVAGLRRVADRVSVPLCSGESEYTKQGCRDLLATGSISYLDFDRSKAGGFTEGRKIAALAEVDQVVFAPHHAAVIHVSFAAAIPNGGSVECHGSVTRDPLTPRLYRRAPEPVEGLVELDDTPGLGLELDLDELERMTRVRWTSTRRRRGTRGSGGSGDAAEDRTTGEASTARVVVEEEPAGDLARREQARHLTTGRVDHPSVLVDADPPVGEGDAARHAVGGERRLVERLRPVRLRRVDTAGGETVLAERIERPLRCRRVEPIDGGAQPPWVEPELLGELLDGVRLHRRAGGVARFEQVDRLAVEKLESERPWLAPDRVTRLRVGQPHLGLTLVDETLGVDVDEQPVGVGVPAHLVGEREVADGGRVGVERTRVAPAPVAERLGARTHGLGQHGAHVEAAPADLHEVPPVAEVAQPHLRVGLEPAAGEHDLAAHLDVTVVAGDAEPVDGRAVGEQRGGRRRVPDLDADGLDRFEQPVHQAHALADAADGATRREDVRVVGRDVLGVDELADGELPLDAAITHPPEGLGRLGNEARRQGVVVASRRGRVQVAAEVLGGVGRDEHPVAPPLRLVGEQGSEVVHAIV
jgi:L-alanine-DL-glutamate epimerase-like enolase superfamily enzyme